MTNNTKTYDFIIAGTGAAGLSLAMQLKRSTVKFDKVLLIDKDLKNKNDRTWCFWTKKNHSWFEEVIFKKWNQFEFKSNTFEKKLLLKPYRYVMIRGLDFYNYCLNEIRNDSRFDIVTDTIKEIGTEKSHGFLKTEDCIYQSNYIFNSAFRNSNTQAKHVNFVQHFKGILIQTEEDLFDENCPVFMDFRTEQHNDCRFFYILPFSKNKALIEYTGFSPLALKEETYDYQLRQYIRTKFNIQKYTILETELGEIPMMESEFTNPFGEKVINIGIAGGSSKPSTGYTFYFIQKHVSYIIHELEQNKKLNAYSRNSKYKLFDRVLLDVMNRNKIPADELFTSLFEKNKIENLLTFLNEETTFAEDLRIMNSVSKLAFIGSTIKKLIQ